MVRARVDHLGVRRELPQSPPERRYIQSALDPRRFIDTWAIYWWTKAQIDGIRNYEKVKAEAGMEWYRCVRCPSLTQSDDGRCAHHKRIDSKVVCRWKYCRRKTEHESGVCAEHRISKWIMAKIEEEADERG